MTIVIFGGNGDLAHRKLLPAFYNVHVDGLLPPRIAIVGVGRKAMSDDAYREFAKDGITKFSRRPIDEQAWQTFAAMLFFVNASLDDEQGLAPLGARLDIVEHERGLNGDRIYYLAIPPTLFAPTVKQLARSRFVPPPEGRIPRLPATTRNSPKPPTASDFRPIPSRRADFSGHVSNRAGLHVSTMFPPISILI